MQSLEVQEIVELVKYDPKLALIVETIMFDGTTEIEKTGQVNIAALGRKLGIRRYELEQHFGRLRELYKDWDVNAETENETQPIGGISSGAIGSAPIAASVRQVRPVNKKFNLAKAVREMIAANPDATCKEVFEMLVDPLGRPINKGSVQGVFYRIKRGNSTHKLSKVLADEIRRREKTEGLSAKELGRLYRVNVKSIRKILQGKTYV
jgi:hypothetical protein